MNIAMVSQTIQLILAPVVMLTACALILNSVVVRYGAIAEHLRALSRERLDLLRRKADSLLDIERMSEIDTEVPELLKRHKQLHDALLFIYTAVLVFIINMFAIAIIVTSGSQDGGLVAAVLVIFLLGLALLFIAVLVITIEVRHSHRVSQYEARRVTSL